VIYISAHSEVVGGGELSLLELMQSLPALYQPVLVLPEEGGLQRRAQQLGIATSLLPMPKLGWRSLPASRHWLVGLRHLRPSLLHANNSRAAFYAGIAGRLLGIPVIFHCRITEPDPRLDWLLVHLVHCVIANSQATAARFRAWPKLPLTVAYNGIAVSALPERAVETRGKPFGAQHILLCVARVSRWKRHNIVLDVFTHLAGTMPDLHLLCVGGPDPHDPEWWTEMQARSRSSAFAERIHWLGPQDDVGAWYQAADVLVLASVREPFGRVVVEAMAWGVPVVAFRSGGVSEIITHAGQGCLIEEGNIVGMRDAVWRLLENAALRKHVGEAGRERAQAFSVAAHVAAVCRAYEELLEADRE